MNALVRCRRACAVAALTALVLGPAAATVAAPTVTQTVPVRSGEARVVAPASQQVGAGSRIHPWHAVAPGPHTFYGTIVAMRNSLLAIRLRNGRVQSVDATAAIAHGDYSAPLFVGKLVGVDGTSSGASFVVAHIFRVTNLDALRSDR